MSTVGLIANPAAGKDIRRLVAHASTFDNNEKVNIVRRVLLGLDATGVEEVLMMPDYFGIGARALKGLDLSLRCTFIEMVPEFAQEDSTRAAAHMRALGVACIVTLGGDGTNRAVAKGCGQVPLVPLSTGTNNAFPRMIEGTVAGLAAGYVASRGSQENIAPRTLCLEVLREGEVSDLALIDVVVSSARFVGARAIWDEESVQQIITTRAVPDTTGFSSVGALLDSPPPGSREGLALDMGPGGRVVMAPIAPGLIRPLDVRASRVLALGDVVPIRSTPCILALDGERETRLLAGEQVGVRLSDRGPRVVDVSAALRHGAGRGFFVREAQEGGEIA